MMRLSWIGALASMGAFLFPAASHAVITDGLVSYWPMDGNVADAVGPNNGTPMGMAPLSFASGANSNPAFQQALDLDRAQQQFVDVGLDRNLTAEVTGNVSISAWFTVESFDVDWQALIANGEGGQWRMHRSGGSSNMAYNTGNGNNDITGADYPVDDGGWHHIVAITEGGVRSELWIDGQMRANNTGLIHTDLDPNTPTLIGENPDATGRWWNGKIDDVGIWDRPITPAEVAELWSGGVGRPIISDPNQIPLEGDVDLVGFTGDENNMDVVNLADFQIIRQNYQQMTANGRGDGDLNFNGVVGPEDFRKWKDNNGRDFTSRAMGGIGASIPEPSAMALAALVAAAIGVTRRGRRYAA